MQLKVTKNLTLETPSQKNERFVSVKYQQGRHLTYLYIHPSVRPSYTLVQHMRA